MHKDTKEQREEIASHGAAKRVPTDSLPAWVQELVEARQLEELERLERELAQEAEEMQDRLNEQ